MPLPDPTQDRLALRVSDSDRHQVAEVLRQAAGEGRLDLDELDERLEATFRAKTYADLVPITLDLPTSASVSPVTRQSAPAVPVVVPHMSGEPERHFVVMSGFERKGVWTVPARMDILAVMGGADLDLRQASYAAGVCELRVHAIMGGVSLTVPHGVRVVFAMTSVMGGHSDDGGQVTDPEAPTLLIKGFCLMGGVAVERKDPTDPRSLER